MFRQGMKTAFATAALGAVLAFAAGPALALQWTCTATNARGASYTRSATGVSSAAVHNRAGARALAACRGDSYAPRSCVVVACSPS